MTAVHGHGHGHWDHHGGGTGRRIIRRRTIIRRRRMVRRGGQGNQTIIIINNGGRGFGGGGVSSGLFNDGYPGSAGFDYGQGNIVATPGFYNGGNRFGSGFGHGGHRFNDSGRFEGGGLTGNNALNGVLAAGGAGVLAPELGGTSLGAGGGAAAGSIFGDGDPKKSALIGAGVGAGINLLGQFADGASFGGQTEDNPEGKDLDWGSVLTDGVTGGGLAGLFNIE